MHQHLFAARIFYLITLLHYYIIIKEEFVMKKILALITLLMLFALATSDVSAMSSQEYVHQMQSQFLQYQIISNMQNSYRSQKIKSSDDEESTTQINESSPQEIFTSEKSHEQTSNSHSMLSSEIFNTFLYLVVNAVVALFISCVLFAVVSALFL